VSYAPSLVLELEEALKNASDEAVYSIRDNVVYYGDQILFYGDLATRLGGPFVHRNRTSKALKEIRRTAVAYTFEKDNTSFADIPEKIPFDKSSILPEASVQKLLSALYELFHNEFDTALTESRKDGFLPCSGNFTSSKDLCAKPQYFSMIVLDNKGREVELVCQRMDVPVEVEQAYASELAVTDEKMRSLISEEVRASVGMELLGKVLVNAQGGRYLRVETELDTTASIREKLKGKKF